MEGPVLERERDKRGTRSLNLCVAHAYSQWQCYLKECLDLNQLLCLLSLSVPGLDQSHGGDYDAFEDQVCKFFKALRDCDIDPFVIVDGGSDYTDKKFETKKNRALSRINRAKSLSMGLQGSGGILPTLIKHVFKQVLISLNVPYAQCICEADQDIASLARSWNCPVLSNDSDFYIFDIQAGFLPTSHFHWQRVSMQRGSSIRYIPCKQYTTTSFCRHFNINRQVLPVFAAMLGNDYVKLHNMGVSLRWEEYTSMEGRFARFDGLLNWLARFHGQKDALDSVLRLISHCNNRQKTGAVLHGLSLGIEEYHLPPSCLERFFNDGVGPGPGRLPEPLRVLPDWTLLPLMEGRLPSCMVDVLLLGRMMQGAQVEDPSLPCGNNTSRSIRQVLYGLLLGGRRADHSRQRPPVDEVEEYYREGKSLTSSMVEAILPSAAEHIQLDTLHQAPRLVQLKVFLETLGVSQSTLSGVPPHLRLPVAVTCYWLRHAHSPPELPVLQALLLGLVYGELCRKRKSQRGFMEGPVLERLRGLIQRGRRSLDLGVAHAYSQWQCCLKESLHLNQLLCFPLDEPQCAWLYKGTLVHQLVTKLRGGLTPDSLLMGDLGSGQLYRAMLGAILNSHDSHEAAVIPFVSGLQRATPPSLTQPLDDLTAHLHILALEYDDDDGAGGGSKAKSEDDLGWTLVSVRTRHKSKDRFNRARNPEFSRKQGRIGWE
ncbi:protein asteroid homolog 1 [Oncorhynchus mykiss]|uniref:Asteroid homolog 1 n=1 Tax=Oncorhynchus mykiss TaxID=8022 RepID=A0A8C7NGE2_ONCMY|nr:protein asteroid homolog 1 [Oncorhynchus mykiss]XP_036817859.1 protein asteroid homolog 1 [Oncorhynchus mykiss]